ncbi:uncharacterized protein LOC135371405 isoform X3 [Ornithodoros turicata]|uniref:uncharacterized protein LOC135371405 isoform X3 n=1 Tax=Ornithodoros turicata TaxID=34597 RepID=UPI0031397584
MAASGSIAIKVEPEDTSSSIFPGNHDGLEEFITDDYPSNTLFQSESTLVKEEAQDTMVSPLRGNQANGDEFINDDNQGHSGSNTARDSTQKRRKMLCPNTNPRKPCYSRRKSSKAHCRLLRKKRRLKAHATIGDSQADTLQLSDGALEESLFTRDLSMARDCTEVEGSEHRPLETPPGATTVRSAVTYIKEEPHDARHFPSHGTSGNAEVVAETVMVPSDFFCVKEEPSSPLPGNDEDIDELLMSDQTEAEISSSGFISIKEEPQCSSSSVPPDTWIHESIEDLITDNRPGKLEVIKWLMEHGALQKDMRCPLCRQPTTLRLSCRTTARWICRRRGHYWSESVFYNSVFRNLRVPLDSFLHMMLIFARGSGTYSYIADNYSRGNRKLSHSTISRGLYLLRRAISVYMERRNAADGKIGGRRRSVEIYESVFRKRVNNKGCKSSGQWVLIMADREPSLNKNQDTKVRVLVCPNKKRVKATLIPLIKRNVKRGTTLITQGRGSYYNLETLGEDPRQWKRLKRPNYYKHRVANQRARFVSSQHPELHTQTAQSRWHALKQPLIRSGMQRRDLQLYLDEQMWREELKTSEKDPFSELLRCIGIARSRVFTGPARLQHTEGAHHQNNRHKDAQRPVPAQRQERNVSAPIAQQPSTITLASASTASTSVTAQPMQHIQHVSMWRSEENSTLHTLEKSENTLHGDFSESLSAGVSGKIRTCRHSVTLLAPVPVAALQPIMFVTMPVHVVQTLGSFIPVQNYMAPYILQPSVDAQSSQQLAPSPSHSAYTF